MTFTINVLEVLRFMFIVVWLVGGGFFLFASSFFSSGREDKLFAMMGVTLCLGSALVLYFGK
jgi:hypothetical protein